MAEDRANPLNNPGVAEAISGPPAPVSEPAPRDSELEDFLDEILPAPSSAAPSPPAEVSPVQEEPPAEPRAVVPTALPRDPSTEVPTALPVLAQPPAGGAAPAEASQEALQREVLQRLNEQLRRMGEPAPEPPPPPAPQLTPEQLVQQLQPRVQQYVDAGWITEDHALLYPRETALQVHMWDQLQAGASQLQEARQFTEGEQIRRVQESASRQLDNAIADVAARGEVFGALSADEVRQGFREYIIELNPVMSQINPDFLARQFYAYNSQLIYDLARQQGGPSPQQETPAAQLAQQEGGSSRASAVSPQPPEFADLLDGTAAARWYQ